MLTKKGVTSLLSKIYDSGGMTEDMETYLKQLQDELDEREGLLRKYGEPWDENEEKVDFREIDYKAKYEELRDAYVNQLFTPKNDSPDVYIEPQETVVDKKLTIEDLFE